MKHKDLQAQKCSLDGRQEAKLSLG